MGHVVSGGERQEMSRILLGRCCKLRSYNRVELRRWPKRSSSPPSMRLPADCSPDIAKSKTRARSCVGSVNLTERDWESTVFGYAEADSVDEPPIQVAAGTPVTSFHMANRTVISER